MGTVIRGERGGGGGGMGTVIRCERGGGGEREGG